MVKSFKKKPKITILEIGDPVYLLHSSGKVLGSGKVEGEVNNYVLFKGRKYWKRGVDGKHRYINNYLNFLMNPTDAREYATAGQITGDEPSF